MVNDFTHSRTIHHIIEKIQISGKWKMIVQDDLLIILIFTYIQKF